MHTFEVWAPRAESLQVQVDGSSHEMKRHDHGWWRVAVGNAQPGTRYAFSVNDGKPLPDPRSRYQPGGIHQPSMLVDDQAFQWTDKAFQPVPLASAVIYEMHVGTFTPEGTFRGAIDKLDYLASLGITHIEIMPVNEFSGPWGWGYDGVDLYAPHHQYGSPDDLKALVNACHQKNLAVLLDVVYNHFGPAGNYLGEFGPYLTDKHLTPWGDAVNLDSAGSHEVRQFFIDNALMWLREYHFDGLRLDAVHAFVDSSAIHFLEELADAVDLLSARLGKYKVLIAESELNDPRLVRSREANGYGLDAQWADDLHHGIHTVLTSETNGYYEDYGRLEQLAKALQTPFIYDGEYSVHRDRFHGRAPLGLTGHHFVVCIQNHDQVGNRAQGERLSQLVSVGRQKIAAALLFIAPYVPMIFAGEEYGASTPFQYFSQHEDEELGAAVSKGRTNEFKAFGWSPDQVPDPQSEKTFKQSKLNWAELETSDHADMLQWYRKLIALRRELGLTDGRLNRVKVDFNEDAQWLTVRRGSVFAAVNLAQDAQAIPGLKPGSEVVCASHEGWRTRPGLVELPGESVVIFVQATEGTVVPGRMKVVGA